MRVTSPLNWPLVSGCTHAFPLPHPLFVACPCPCPLSLVPLSLRSSEAVQIRRLQEHAALHRRILPGVRNELAVLVAALFVQRPVARMEDRARHHLVRRKEIGQQLVP